MKQSLYKYFWSSNDSWKSVFKIPDTVIYQNNFIHTWYFTNKHGYLKKKNNLISLTKTQNANSSKIHTEHPQYATFSTRTKKISSLHKKSMEKKLSTSISKASRSQSMGKSRLLMEFSRSSLILDLTIIVWIALQAVIQCNWTKHISSFAKRTTKKNLTHLGLDIYQRVCTFDGPQHYSQVSNLILPVPLKGDVTTFLRSAINQFLDRIQQQSMQRFKLAGLISYYKRDIHSNFWFLYSTSVVQEQQKQSMFGYAHKVELPGNIDTSMLLNNRSSLKIKVPCPLCNELENQNKTIQTMFSFLFKVADKPHPQRKKLISKADLLLLAARLYPRMTKQQYQMLDDNPGGCLRKLKICQTCFLQFLPSQSIQLNKIQFTDVKQFKQKRINSSQRTKYPSIQKSRSCHNNLSKKYQSNKSIVLKKKSKFDQLQSYLKQPKTFIKNKSNSHRTFNPKHLRSKLEFLKDSLPPLGIQKLNKVQQLLTQVQRGY